MGGGGKSGGGGGGGSQTTTSTFSPWQPNILKEYIKMVNSQIPGWGGPESNWQYQGPQYQLAGFTPAENQGMDLELGAIPGMSAMYGLGSGAIGTSLGGGYFNPNANPYLAGAGPSANPYMRGMLPGSDPYLDSSLTSRLSSFNPTAQFTSQDPYLAGGTQNPYLSAYSDQAARQLTNQYQATTAPSQMSQAELSGAFGGSADAEARALNQYGLGQNLASLNAQIYEPAWQQQAQMWQQGAETGAGLQEQALQAAMQGQNEQAGLFNQAMSNAANLYAQQSALPAELYGTQFGQAMQNQMGALGLLPQMESLSTLPGETALSVGGLQQNQAQNQLNADYQNAYNKWQWPYQMINWLGQAATGVNQGFGQGTQTADFGGGGPSIGQTLLGGGLGLGALGGMLFTGGNQTPWQNFMRTGLGQAANSLWQHSIGALI